MQDNDNHAAATVAKLALAGLPSEVCTYCGEPAELVCDTCEAEIARKNARIQAEQKEARRRRRTEWFNSKIDPAFQIRDELLTPRWALDLADRWDSAGRHGVTFVGPSNTWKTRGGILLLEKAFVAGRRFEIIQAGDLRRTVNQAAKQGNDSAVLADLIEVEILMVDDLGNQAPTETSDEFLLTLFDKRAAKQRPTIITTQYPADEFVARSSTQRIGTSIARRIGPDFNWVVRSADGTITPPNQ